MLHRIWIDKQMDSLSVKEKRKLCRDLKNIMLLDQASIFILCEPIAHSAN